MNKTVFSVTKKDLEITYFSGTGAGGQHRNRHMCCVRIKHKDTGIIKTGQSHKDKRANLKEAFHALVKDKRFMSYCQMKLRELEENQTLEEKVESMLNPENLKIEYKTNATWSEIEDQ